VSIHAHPILTLVWISTIAGYCYLATLVLRDRQWCFLALISFHILENAILLACSAARAAHLYHSVYWSCYPISVTLITVQAYRSFANIFGPYQSMPRRFFHEFAAAMFLLSVAIAALYLRFPSMRSGVDGPLFTMLRTTETWMCGVFVLISLFSDRYGIPWDTRAFGIAFGCLTRTFLGLALAAIYAHAPGFSPQSTKWIPIIYASHFAIDATACTIWAAWFLKKSRRVEIADASQLQTLSDASVFLKKISVGSVRNSVKCGIDRLA
jgi:hypothetical protein